MMAEASAEASVAKMRMSFMMMLQWLSECDGDDFAPCGPEQQTPCLIDR
jgi:hypothetical protein